MFYSDKDIRNAIDNGSVKINPIVETQIQPASIDLRLDNKFLVQKPQRIITMSKPITYKKEIISDSFILYPKSFVLATTIETVELSNNIVAFVQGRSSVGRLGLFIQNAGWVDPGFKGQITLELYNAGNSAILLESDRRICQLSLAETKTEATTYNGKYQNQFGVTGSKMFQDIEVKETFEKYILSNENVND